MCHIKSHTSLFQQQRLVFNDTGLHGNSANDAPLLNPPLNRIVWVVSAGSFQAGEGV